MLRSIFGMDKFILLFIILFHHVACSNIVYVYLSAQLPPYIHVALEQARLFNPNTDIYLIANQQAINLCQETTAKSNIITIAAESLRPSKYHQLFERNSTLNTSMRDGFWKKATERFFYIHELMASRNLKSVVHVESDNMLYVDISEIQDALSHYPGIGAVFDAHDRCIPSVVYFADEKAIAHLIGFIAANASKGYYDMQIIALYHNTFPKEYIDNLPLIMPEYLATHQLMNAASEKPRKPHKYLQNIDLFNSIFDGAAIGQYLGGIDPRNGESKPGFINETCVFNPSYLTFEWHKDAEGRNVPFALCNGAKYRINNLHIHSKFLENFRS